jgi:hypothetical protein
MHKKRIGLSKLEWQLFVINLIPGLTWGLCGVLFAQRVLGVDAYGRVGEWEMARPLIIIGMGLGVPINAVIWLRRGCPTQRGLSNLFLGAFKNIIVGILFGTLFFGIEMLWMMLIPQLSHLQNVSLSAIALLPFMILAAIMFGAIGAVFTVIPMSLFMQPLTNLIWKKWFVMNEKEIRRLAEKPILETRQMP